MGGNEEQLLQSIREFLKQEKEIYGGFQVPGSGKSTVQNEEAASGKAKDPVKLSNTDEQAKPGADTDPGEIVTDADPEQAQSLEELKKICRLTTVLRTDLENTNLVFGTGNPDARIMFIGEAPGFQEDKQGEPFVGRAGQLLNKILEAISFRREEVYIANILKHRPPNNRDPLPEERKRSLPYLYRQIDLVDPQIIVCLGRVSAQTLLDTDLPMKALRGKFHSFRNNIPLMVTYHPAALLRNPAWKKDAWEDVKMLRKWYDEQNPE